MTAKVKAAKESTAAGTPTFEESLQRLEQIVETIEQGKVTLDEVMKMYEEGVLLSKSCLEQLSRAEARLKRLGKEVNGNFSLVDDDQNE